MSKAVRLILAGSAALAAASAGAADPAAGKAKFEACAACHSPGAAPQGAVAPLLYGQPDNFLQWQLVYFRSGARSDPVMAPMAASLTDADIRNLGAYLAALPAPKPPLGKDERPDLTEAGGVLVKANHCASCHQEGLVGRDAVPRLAAQREAYLLKALRDFKAGKRRGGGVAAMADAVYPLSDNGLQALAHYLARLR